MNNVLGWIKAHKVLIAIIIVFLIIIGAAGTSRNKKTNNLTTSNKSSSNAQNASVQPVRQTPTVPYQTIKRTDNETGTYLVAVVDTSKDNSTDLRNLCNEYHQEAISSQKYYHADVYDDATAASDRDKVINDQASDAQTSNYDLHYVMIYNYNPGHDNHCQITVQGDNDPSPIDINY